MNPETLRLLEIFSGAANQSSAASHPLDQERLYAFIISAHQEKAEMDVGEFMHWLTSHGWSESVAIRVGTQYETARSILSYYDAHR